MQTTGNTVLLTGGSSGIGLALARKFLGLGNTVIVTGRDNAKLAAVKQELPAVELFCGDLTKDETLADLVLFVEQRHPKLNILINNAGVQYNYRFLQPSNKRLEEIEYEIQTNLVAPIKLTALLLPTILNNSNAAIVNVSSALGFVPKQSAPVYCSTKAGLHLFTKALRYQLEDTPVKVFEIIPPLVETAMTAGRGKGKIPPAKLADDFLKAFERDNYEVKIGKAKLLLVLSRLFPKIAERVMKNK